MKLYLIHVGFYDSELMDGLYEQYGNFFLLPKIWKKQKLVLKWSRCFKIKHAHWWYPGAKSCEGNRYKRNC